MLHGVIAVLTLFLLQARTREVFGGCMLNCQRHTPTSHPPLAL